MPYRTIVVGTDGSETALRAVAEAADLAVATGARLVIVTAYEGHQHLPPELHLEAPDELRWLLTDASQAADRTAEARRLAAGRGVADIVTLTEEGPAGRVLVRVAGELDADVVVVGSVGLTGPARFVLGSVPNEVSHHAPCDVLIVHTAGGR